MPSPTLRECPFCGGNDIELETSATERAGKWTWYDAMVACHSCRCKTGHFAETSKSDAVDLAVAAWNRRAENRKETK